MDSPEIPQSDTQETPPPVETTPPPPNITIKRTQRILFLLLVSLLILAVLVWQTSARDDTSQDVTPTPATGTVSPTHVPTDVPTPGPTYPPETVSYPSPTEDYTLVLTQTGDNTSCKVEVFDAQGEVIPLQFNFETVECESYFGPESSSFLGWVNPTSVLFESEEGVLTIYEMGGEQTNVTYDSEDWSFWSTNYVLTQWIYRNRHISKDTFEFVDMRGNSLREALVFEGSVFIFDYDHVNHGYFIVERSFTDDGFESQVTYVFYWLDEQTLKLHELVTITNEFPGGRGCGEGKLESVPGEIVYHGLSCFALPPEYHEVDELRFAVPQ